MGHFIVLFCPWGGRRGEERGGGCLGDKANFVLCGFSVVSESSPTPPPPQASFLSQFFTFSVSPPLAQLCFFPPPPNLSSSFSSSFSSSHILRLDKVRWLHSTRKTPECLVLTADFCFSIVSTDIYLLVFTSVIMIIVCLSVLYVEAIKHTLENT